MLFVSHCFMSVWMFYVQQLGIYFTDVTDVCQPREAIVRLRLNVEKNLRLWWPRRPDC